MSLRAKLTITFLVLSILPTLVAGYIAYDTSRAALEEATLDRLVLTNVLKSDELERWIASNEASLEALAQRPLVRQYAALLLDPAAPPPDVATTEQRLLADHFQPALDAQASFLQLAVLDAATGTIRIATDAALNGQVRADEPYFIAGRTGTYTQHPAYHAPTDTVLMHISTPVRDDTGSVIAVLAGYVDFTEMSAIMGQDAALSETAETYLVNADRAFVTESRFQPGVVLVRTADSPGVRDCLAHHTGTGFYTDYRGVTVAGAYQWLPESELCILTEIDRDEALATVDRLRNALLALGGGAALVCAALGVVIARMFGRPIHALAVGTRQLRQGNLDYRVPVRGQDELAQLADSFNHMAADLHQSQITLQASEESLRRERDFVEAVVNTSAALTIVLDRAGHIVRFNRGCEVLTGYTADEMHGQPFWERLLPPDEVAGVKAAFETLCAGATDHHYENHWVTKTGDRRLISWANTYLTGPAGDIEFIVGTGIDITERHRAETALRDLNTTLEQRIAERTAELRASEARFRRAILDAPLPLMMHAEGGDVLVINDTWTELTGYSLADIPTINDWVGYAYGEQHKLVKATIDRLYDLEHKVDEGEFVIHTRHGETRTWAFSSSPLGGLPDGRRLVLSMAMDITERKQAEIARERYAEELARSNEELQQFAYVASHDLQEPLRMITSYLQLIERRYKHQIDADADQFIAFAVDGANRMKRLINDLLAYSRVGTRGKAFAPTDCAAVLTQVQQNLALAIADTGATITHDPLPTVWGDKSQLVLLLQNLISNAIKFRGSDPPQIHISVTQRSDAGEDEWVFRVRDNGLGIEPQYFDRIFVIFQRLHNQADYPGTGIGLAITRKIVERHNGRIWVDSTPGAGSTFVFTLPVVPAPGPAGTDRVPDTGPLPAPD